MTNGLQFDFDWIDPQGARGEELRATWATLWIQVDETPVTRILDLRSKTVRDEVFTPVYPLAEWIATNWWKLLFETTRPALISRAAVRHNHSLAEAREGFAYPDLTFEPLGERIRLRWNGETLPHAGIEFLNTGESLVSLGSAEAALR